MASEEVLDVPSEFTEPVRRHLNARGLRKRTIDTYMQTVAGCAWQFAPRPPERWTSDDLTALCADWSSISPSRQMGNRAALKALLTAHGREDLVATIPKGPRVEQQPVEVPTEAEWQRLLLAAWDRKDKRPLLTLGLTGYGGLRGNELRDLEADDIDLEAHVMIVRDGKGGKSRKVPLVPELERILAEFAPKAGPVVQADKGGRAQGQTMVGWLHTLGREANVDKPMTLRNMRQLFGVRAMRQNIPIRATQQAMGHSSVKTTVDVYQRGATEEDMVAAFRGGADTKQEAEPDPDAVDPYEAVAALLEKMHGWYFKFGDELSDEAKAELRDLVETTGKMPPWYGPLPPWLAAQQRRNYVHVSYITPRRRPVYLCSSERCLPVVTVGMRRDDALWLPRDEAERIVAWLNAHPVWGTKSWGIIERNEMSRRRVHQGIGKAIARAEKGRAAS